MVSVMANLSDGQWMEVVQHAGAPGVSWQKLIQKLQAQSTPPSS
jgi:hypothetical protein